MPPWQCPYNPPPMFQLLDRMAQSPLGAVSILVIGVAVLLLGGNWLVHGSVTIARRIGMSTLVVGLTIVAAGTSAPELAFNVIAATGGHGDLSFGNIVGSNIANIGLILGLTTLLMPLVVHGRVISKELPWLLGVSVAMVGLLVLPWLWNRQAGFAFDRLDGVVMLVCFAIFMVGWYRLGRREAADPQMRELREETEAETMGSLAGAITFLVIGLGCLFAGGKLSEIGAVHMARWLGLSEALIGLTIVAFATSLPELATAIIASMKGHHDLAVGNVIGSNVFNLLLVLGATATISPVDLPLPWGWWDLIAMILITMVLMAMAFTHRKITRWEGGLLLMLYLGYMTFSVWREV